MAKYLLLKHYRGGPAPAVDWAPMDQWTPDEVDAHVQFMRDFAARLEGTGEFVDTQALAHDGAFVRYDGEGRATDDRRAVRRDQGPDRRVVHHRRGVVGPRGTAGGQAVGGPRARRQADLRMAGGSGRFWPTRPRSPSERAAAADPR